MGKPDEKNLLLLFEFDPLLFFCPDLLNHLRSEFFYAFMAIQGISVQEVSVARESSTEAEKHEIENYISSSVYGPDFCVERYDMFAVKHWDTSEEFVFLDEGILIEPILNSDKGILPGVVGQGGNQPRPIFGSHVIIKLDNGE